ncbi:MAG TPA: ABC transporter ATP-binding protein [Candidatus Saccharimonadales bacterium]|nr:ABC transporter ATP-binding protein [Candidatus Saccharimonadales bacterium]
MPAISINGLSVNLAGKNVLHDVSVEIPEGKIVGLLGPSGAGKTSLIKTLLGLRKISGGTISVLGLPAGNSKLRSKIGYMSQDLSVYTDLTVWENMDYFSVLVRAEKHQAESILKQLELFKLKDNLVSNLSGGQKARVSLAIALLGKPELLLLDEPTVGLDPVLRRTLWEEFRRLAGKGMTVIITSHVMDEAEKCNEILFIRDGRLLISGTKDEIFKKTGASDMEQAFLELSKGGYDES